MHSSEIQTKIDQVKVMEPNYPQLSATWENLMSQKLREEINKAYKDASLTNEQVEEMVDINIEKIKNSITQEEFFNELDQIHKVNIDSVVKQLEIMKNEALQREQIMKFIANIKFHF